MSKGTPAETNNSTLKGLRIKTLSLWMVACTVLISILIGAGIVFVMQQYHALVHMTHEYILTQKDVMNMSLGSDYLTEQARLYAITRDSAHADAYFTEADVTQRRDRALQEMAGHLEGNDEVSLQLLADALDLSNALMDLEIHSMKLAALSVGEDLSTLSPRIRDYSLPEEELQYTALQKAEAADQLVFGPEYRSAKQAIEEKLESVTESVISICSQKQAESEEAMKRALVRQSIYTVLIVLLVILAYVMISILILRPIRIYIDCIQNNNFLEIVGAYEFKYLAITYNNIYEMSVEKHNLLRQKAEQDALTGLPNRAAFEHLKAKLGGMSHAIALLLVDVDVFKSINDTYGHEMGDQALIRTAALLRDNFRSLDAIFRIGGDEFAVVMEKLLPDQKDIIKSKIDKINWELQHPQGDFPKYSVSVGTAFSANGYHDELFRQADQALYQTKNEGRCGCTFFNGQSAAAGPTGADSQKSAAKQE